MSTDIWGHQATLHHLGIVQELCESRGGRPGLSVLTSLLVSVDVKIYWTVLRHWSQLVPEDIKQHFTITSIVPNMLLASEDIKQKQNEPAASLLPQCPLQKQVVCCCGRCSCHMCSFRGEPVSSNFSMACCSVFFFFIDVNNVCL